MSETENTVQFSDCSCRAPSQLDMHMVNPQLCLRIIEVAKTNTKAPKLEGTNPSLRSFIPKHPIFLRNFTGVPHGIAHNTNHGPSE